MSITNSNKIVSVALTRLRVGLGGLVILLTAGCGSDGGTGAVVTIDPAILVSDLRLNLRCEDVGIYLETCILEDNNNPYRNVETGEFDVNNPDEPVGKLELLEAIPAGPTGAKARFYLWATALARRASGENQYFTALALHELWTWQVEDGFGDPLIQQQALKAYRSLLDNFFGSATFLSTCDFLNPSPPRPEYLYPIILTDAAGENLVDPTTVDEFFNDCNGDPTIVAPGLVTLFPFPEDTPSMKGEPTPVESQFEARETLGGWGYTYVEVDDDTVFVRVN